MDIKELGEKVPEVSEVQEVSEVATAIGGYPEILEVVSPGRQKVLKV